jgi:hypothetical protein
LLPAQASVVTQLIPIKSYEFLQQRTAVHSRGHDNQRSGSSEDSLDKEEDGHEEGVFGK